MSFRIFTDSFNNQSVAVVGNASGLLRSKYGELINSHDVVIRFNETIMTVPECLGTKSTILALSGSCKSMDKFLRNLNLPPKNTILTNLDAQQSELTELPLTLNQALDNYLTTRNFSDNVVVLSVFNSSYKKLHKIKDDERVFSLSQYEDEWRSLVPTKPTSGFAVINYLDKYCSPDSVSIFGFDWKRTESNYDRRGNKRLGTHSWKKEEAVIKEIISKRQWDFHPTKKYGWLSYFN